MPKKHMARTNILSTILALVVGIQIVGVATANPIHLGEVPPDANTSPPSVTIISPENRSYNNSSICLNITVSEGKSKSASFTMINNVYYKADWKTDEVSIFSYDEYTMIPNIHNYSTAINLTDIPQGTHSIIIYAVEIGTYKGSGLTDYYTFTVKNSASTTFTIDTLANPTPTANQSTPTSDTGLPFELNPPIIYIILALVIAIIVVASISLVYFKKHGGRIK
jgi:hypothetical protein